MKIGIFTFHCAINYGAVLQAYGLQEYLKGLGHEVYIIDYRPDYLLYPYRIFRWNDSPKHPINRLKWFIRELMVIPIRWKRKIHFSKFVKKYLNLYDLDLNNPDNDFDAFVFGSDQIWNKKITRGYDEVFFGNFLAAKNKILMSYSASCGSVPEIILESDSFLSRLEKFTRIGVRENSLYQLLLKKQVSAILNIDPVLLSGIKTFDEISDKIDERSPYLLLLTLGRDEYALPIAAKLSKKMRLPIIELMSSSESVSSNSIKQTVPPERYISYIKKASFVVTTSFHGTAFSVLFNKNFYAVTEQTNDRIESLLSLFNLNCRYICVKDGCLDYGITYSDIEYDKINKNIDKYREVSASYLNDIL